MLGVNCQRLRQPEPMPIPAFVLRTLTVCPLAAHDHHRDTPVQNDLISH